MGCLDEEAFALIRLFTQMGTIISSTVIPAVTIPTKDPAQDPFLIFFTNDDQRRTVQNVFRDLASGATKTQGGSTIRRPTFVCVNDQSGPYVQGAVDHCKSISNGVAFVSITWQSLPPYSFHRTCEYLEYIILTRQHGR